MRIIGGAMRGTHLTPVGAGDPAAHLRPTSDRVREAVFNLLLNSQHFAITGARVLDLFAGTGALGLEALSRGAAHVTFVDDGKVAGTLLRRNVEICRAGGASHILRQNATRLDDCRGPGFDLVFLDPPYGKGLGEAALASASAGRWLAPDALVVWEEGSPPPPPAGFAMLDQRRYGDTVVTLMRAAP
jgi:16S rRNA (guanine966-N2)-methyltransferase